jgi:hypothetical protein
MKDKSAVSCNRQNILLPVKGPLQYVLSAGVTMVMKIPPIDETEIWLDP